jgi:hypothetical protein
MLVVCSRLLYVFSYILQLDREVKTELPLFLASYLEKLERESRSIYSMWHEAAGMMERP